MCVCRYLNSGPGGIAGCYVHEKHGSHQDLASLPRFAGWWGHRASDRFDMDHKFIPSQGAQVIDLLNFGKGTSVNPLFNSLSRVLS